MRYKIYKYISFFIAIIFFGGCGYTVPSPQERMDTLQNLTASKHLQKRVIKTDGLDIYSVNKDLSSCKGKTLDVYIEGDGLAWITSDTISDNPTPIDPLGLKLFLKDYHKCAIYLARPCQYTDDSRCESRYWTNARFSPVVIESYNEALDKLKKISHASSFRVFGYSGGGAIATILSAKRDDISHLVTICGNLDIQKWADMHYITPLDESLNPADFAGKLSKIDQIHLIGGDDSIVGTKVFMSYLERFDDKSHIRYRIFQGYDHHCCWAQDWENILKELDKQEKKR